MFSILTRLFTGFSMIFLSFKVIMKHLKLMVFSTPSTLWTFFASPILLSLITTHNYLHLPGHLYVFIFSFVGLIIFNFTYLGLSFFQLHHLEDKTIGLAKCVALSWQKINLVLGWSLISALIGTSFFHTSDVVAAQSDTVSHLFFQVLEFFWWLINFLIIPVVAGGNGLSYAASWTIKTIFSQPSIVVGAGGGLLLIKYWLSRFIFYQVIMRTPFLLAYLNLINFTMSDRAFLLLILLPVIGIIVATIISIFMSAVEATLATDIYAKFIGKAPELDRSDFWSIFFMALLVLVVFVLLAFSIASSVMLLAATTPKVQNFLLGLFS